MNITKLIILGTSISIGAGLCWGAPTQEEQIEKSRGFVGQLRQLIKEYFSNENENCQDTPYENFMRRLGELDAAITTSKQNNEIYLTGFNYPNNDS